MKQIISSFTLRKIRSHLTSRITLLAMCGAAVVLGLSGPFGTFESLPAFPRFAYWAFVVVTTYSTALFVVTAAKEHMPSAWPDWAADGLAGALAGPAVTLIVTLINLATFQQSTSSLTTPNGVATLALYCTLISTTVAILIGQAGGLAPFDPAAAPQANPAPLPLMNRLPFAKRGPLVSLQAQDHYVLVTTTNGPELVLMRIADAMTETGDTIGFQTHRSYWVAQNQIASSTRQGEKGTLTLHNGDTLPVSRKYMPNLKSAGFF